MAHQIGGDLLEPVFVRDEVALLGKPPGLSSRVPVSWKKGALRGGRPIVG
jgi:hypothetical protein